MMSSKVFRAVLNKGVAAYNPNVRHLSRTAAANEIFKVQSADDFDKKVMKSSKPVIVDFFATYVKCPAIVKLFDYIT